MSAIRKFAKYCIVLLLGKKSKSRRIIRGTASGYRMWISPTENLRYLLGTDEPHLQKAIRKHVSYGDTVYDIGANVGYVSLSLAKQVGPAGRVVAFEPVPRNLADLRRNIEINGITNIQLWEAAASDRPGEAVLRIAENLSTASLIWHRNNPSATELRIRTVCIDELVERGEIVYPKFIKIDVEGAEAGVSKGMRLTLAAARPVVFVECSEAGREATWKLFHELNYRCQSATTGKWVDEFEAYRHSDFLWLPLPE